jgi:hypothetical protein
LKQVGASVKPTPLKNTNKRPQTTPKINGKGTVEFVSKAIENFIDG